MPRKDLDSNLRDINIVISGSVNLQQRRLFTLTNKWTGLSQIFKPFATIPIAALRCFALVEHLSLLCLDMSHNSPIGSRGHLNSIRHHYESSAQDASFSVEPGSAEDLSKIVRPRVRLCT